jgi:hypothetical protein
MACSEHDPPQVVGSKRAVVVSFSFTTCAIESLSSIGAQDTEVAGVGFVVVRIRLEARLAAVSVSLGVGGSKSVQRARGDAAEGSELRSAISALEAVPRAARQFG